MNSRCSHSQDHLSILGFYDLICRLCSEPSQPRHRTYLLPHLQKKKRCMCVFSTESFWEQRSPLLLQFVTDISCSPQECDYSSSVCRRRLSHPSYSSSSPSFWHQGLVSWKTKIFHEPGQGWGGDSFRMILIRSTQPRSLIYTVHRRVHVPMRI